MALLMLLLPARRAPRAWGFWSPSWPSSAWAMVGGAADLTLPTGVTHSTTPGDPLGGTIGEQWVKFDASGSHGGPNSPGPFYGPRTTDILHGNASALVTDAGALPGVRATRRLTAWFYADGLPSSDAILYGHDDRGGAGNRGGRMQWNTDGTFSLLVDGSPVARSTFTPTLNTPYQLDMWVIFNDSAGNTLAVPQWVGRAMGGIGGALTFNPLFNVTAPTLANLSADVLGGFLGEQTGRGAFNFYLRHVGWGMEDADHPIGLIRSDRLDISALGHASQWLSVGAGGSNVDETGTAVPDDGATNDNTTVISGSPRKQTYAHGAGHYPIASGDTILVVKVAQRAITPYAANKGEATSLAQILSDGTIDYIAPSHGTVDVSNPYANMLVEWQDKPGAPDGGWAAPDLAGFQVGLQALTTGTPSGETYANSDVTTLVAYQKQGEEQPPLPKPVSYATRRQGNPRQRIRRGDIRRLRAA